MPFDSEGNFSRLHNWEDDRINGIDIVTDHMDEEDDNFAAGLTQCFLKSGLSKMQGDFDAGGFKMRNVANGTTTYDAVNQSQLDGVSKSLNDFKAKFQAVNALPSNPDANTYYFIYE